MRKQIYFIVKCHALALLIYGGTISPVFAATQQATVVTRLYQGQGQIRTLSRWHWHHFHGQGNNQFYQDCGRTIKNKYYWGHDQGNGGNSGHNRGINQDNNSGLGNQVINQRGHRGYQRNNQYFQNCGLNVNNQYFFGYHQGNDGNSGYNEGSNQDNSGSTGNQVIN